MLIADYTFFDLFWSLLNSREFLFRRTGHQMVPTVKSEVGN